MDDPALLILLLEQGERSLEDHTRDFLDLANQTHYLDNCLTTFYHVGLNTAVKAKLSGDGPRESLAAYVEWVLINNNSPLTPCYIDEELTSPTPELAIIPV